jgi:CheY-like chemotaxis protein
VASTSDFCILIAEDDAFLRHTTASILRKRGYVVIEAADGAEALWLADHYQSHTIDLLISDLKMPGMAGDELVRQLKLSRPDLPVLIVLERN